MKRVVSNRQDKKEGSSNSRIWYIEKPFRGFDFDEWLYRSYELRPSDVQFEMDLYKKGYQEYLDACKYSDTEDR